MHITLCEKHESVWKPSVTFACYEALMEVVFQVEAFWVVTPCSVVVGYQRFRGPCCLQLTVSQSWHWGPSGTHDQIFVVVEILRFCFTWGVLPVEGTGLSRNRSHSLSVSSNVFVAFLVLFYTQLYLYTPGLWPQDLYSSLSVALVYYLWINNSLDTWTVVCLTATKSGAFKFSVLGFALAHAANICIFTILYDFCLLPVYFCNKIV